MKKKASLKGLCSRHKDCKMIRRKGRIRIICKTNGRFKVTQG